MYHTRTCRPIDICLRVTGRLPIDRPIHKDAPRTNDSSISFSLDVLLSTLVSVGPNFWCQSYQCSSLTRFLGVGASPHLSKVSWHV